MKVGGKGCTESRLHQLIIPFLDHKAINQSLTTWGDEALVPFGYPPAWSTNRVFISGSTFGFLQSWCCQFKLWLINVRNLEFFKLMQRDFRKVVSDDTLDFDFEQLWQNHSSIGIIITLGLQQDAWKASSPLSQMSIYSIFSEWPHNLHGWDELLFPLTPRTSRSSWLLSIEMRVIITLLFGMTCAYPRMTPTNQPIDPYCI